MKMPKTLMGRAVWLIVGLLVIWQFILFFGFHFYGAKQMHQLHNNWELHEFIEIQQEIKNQSNDMIHHELNEFTNHHRCVFVLNNKQQAEKYLGRFIEQWQGMDIYSAIPSDELKALCDFKWKKMQKGKEKVNIALLPLQDNKILAMVFKTERWGPPIFPVIWPLILLGLLLLFLIHWGIKKYIKRPLQELTQLVHKIHLGQDIKIEKSLPLEIGEVQQALVAMNQRIQNANNEKNTIISGINHDLRTPLTLLQLKIEQISDEKLRDSLLKNINDIEELINFSLEYTKGISNMEEARDIDLSSLLDSIISDYQSAGHDCAWQGDYEKLTINAPHKSLKRAILNILDNALRYGSQARISLIKKNNTICIEIRDNGPGIPAEHLPKVFEPFYRVEYSRNRATGGYGLGLSIARSVIESMGGKITLENHPDSGLLAKIMLNSL